ncbi:Gfo/Idh/MocA family oxidoreductase [Roseiconus nitratireducens]|uniref:Gfo/Idh/MocA family oxidoreductase n=1 Tax=Roseiconus nitratireducens TaxID=2605748 RepID=A0A5M6DIB0_9BACT|nr:Gfo/Idh/MocA family oxidoreductase [Roseiconus nitratireducens]KAA5547294.1 Gfo/Idh/MocA family oxidoreductase [Roseiconus nitratireducens]
MSPSEIEQPLSRRGWIQRLAIAGGATSLSALSYRRVWGANERLRVASVGTGGKGWSDLNGVAASPVVQVVALCDIDDSEQHLGRAAEKYSSAKRFADWREMLSQPADVDAVIVSTPDFMHAPVALASMQLGKHVFCQKPLTHTVFESRQMRLAAKRQGVITQMGNQIQSHTAYRTAVRAVHDGAIGKVKEVHTWQAGSPRWPRHLLRPEGSDPVPAHVRWDLWQGVAPRRPYKKGLYHPFNWRGWQAYGTGQLGDFGCHLLDPVFQALQLTAPIELVAEAPPLKPETWTDRATVRYRFPGTARTSGESIAVTWYDAVGVRPPHEVTEHLPGSFDLPSAGSLLIGEKGTLVIPHVAMPHLFPSEGDGESPLPVVEGVDHYVQWADACRGLGTTTSSFDYSGPLSEAVLLGTVAIRFPGETLQWDAEAMRISNSTEATRYLSKEYVAGWEPDWVTV